MEKVTIVAAFQDSASADSVVMRFGDLSLEARPLVAVSPEGGREGRFMVRAVLVIAGWSVVGTAVGGAVGALISYTFGPRGTEGLILQVVSWAIFAHLLIGLWAGYALLADRSGRELTDVETTLSFEASREEAPFLARALRDAGATKVVIQSNAPAGTLARQ